MASRSKTGFLPILSAKKVKGSIPTIAPMYCKDPIQDSSVAVIGDPKGLTLTSLEFSLGSTGEDHVNVVSPVRASKFPKNKKLLLHFAQ